MGIPNDQSGFLWVNKVAEDCRAPQPCPVAISLFVRQDMATVAFDANWRVDKVELATDVQQDYPSAPCARLLSVSHALADAPHPRPGLDAAGSQTSQLRFVGTSGSSGSSSHVVGTSAWASSSSSSHLATTTTERPPLDRERILETGWAGPSGATSGPMDTARAAQDITFSDPVEVVQLKVKNKRLELEVARVKKECGSLKSSDAALRDRIKHLVDTLQVLCPLCTCFCTTGERPGLCAPLPPSVTRDCDYHR